MADPASAVTEEVHNLNTILLQKLSQAVNGHAATATFACGGSIPLSDLNTANSGREQHQVNAPSSVTIRWDLSGDLPIGKLVLPMPHHNDVSHNMLRDLLASCEQATFGKNGEDVLDESYRKAMKLDPEAFPTDFHPSDYGILEAIRQVLLPSMVVGGEGVGIGRQGFRAELYKLNIYSAPSGRFKSHVDTPRGIMQFGSLVVCLPCQHKGGSLRVSHRGKTVHFDWAKTSHNNVQWAAFYGDCVHEVLEVTEGHRVTLTYNLYYTPIGNFARPVSNPCQLPLFDMVRDMLLERDFMSQGGVIGFYCHHQYAHSQESGRKSIPAGFKGVDLAIYSVFHILGLEVGVHPIVENEFQKMGGLSHRDLMKGPRAHGKGDYVYNRLDELKSQHLKYADEDNVSSDDDMDGKLDDENVGYYDNADEMSIRERDENTTIVGGKLHGPTFDENYDEMFIGPVSDSWPHRKVPEIVWMNDPMHQDFAYAAVVYGNQASLTYSFSAAAILVSVPPSAERTLPPARGCESRLDRRSSSTTASSSTSACVSPMHELKATLGSEDFVAASSRIADDPYLANSYSAAMDRYAEQFFRHSDMI